jgi:hypothetical protein
MGTTADTVSSARIGTIATGAATTRVRGGPHDSYTGKRNDDDGHSYNAE